MINYYIFLFAILCFTSFQTSCSSQHAEVNEVIVFKNVNIISMDSALVLKGQTAIVKDGLIDEVGPLGAVSIPEDAQVTGIRFY